MTFIRQLAQARPSSTAAVSLYSPTTSAPYSVTLINIANVSASDVNVSIYHDVDGTTYNETTALIFNKTIVAGSNLLFEATISDFQQTGNIAVKVSVANAATFTAYGTVQGERV